MTDPDDAWLARRLSQLRYRAEHGYERGSMNTQEAQHGIATYMRGCRCELCKEAGRERGRRYRERRRMRDAS